MSVLWLLMPNHRLQRNSRWLRNSALVQLHRLCAYILGVISVRNMGMTGSQGHSWIFLQMVADHRETFKNTSMGCIVHEARILRRASISPSGQGNVIFISRRLLPTIPLFDPPYHLLFWHA